jgi:eukaryotic-like serine/threonine-protein kinase
MTTDDRHDPDATKAYTPQPPAAGERFAPGQMLADRYRIVAALGRGGMGEVYRADDLTLGQPVALKFLPPHLAADPDRLTRFRKEVAAARKISHPHVCRVYDIAEHAGQSFLTMEYVDGEDLSSLLKRVGRLPEEKGVEIARQLCGALAAVHDQGLLHRDLKPANVMLDGRGNVRLTDFGLAAAAHDLSASEARSGTPLYQAPEQLAAKEVTARTDIYALGLVLYELFTGKRAFAGSERNMPPSKPSSHVIGLNPAVERFILRCLEPDPANRPRSVYEVLAGLPGGDPLQAALARGETPSPQLVADAPVEGTLRPAVAGGLLAVVIGGLFLTAWLGDRYKAYHYVPLPAPAVMEDKARTVVRGLGYTDPPADSGGGFTNNVPYLKQVVEDGKWADERQHLNAARPAVITYWYRQSPQVFSPIWVADQRRDDNGRLLPSNPPHDIHGMVMVQVDARGRLVGLVAVPDPNASPPARRLEWDDLLRAAELDANGSLRRTPDISVTPPVYADDTAAWEGSYPERTEIPIRVEAASYRGRPVYFRIIHTAWEVSPESDRGAYGTNPVRNKAGEVAVTVVFLGVLTTLVILAVRNLRLGRGDRRGALRLAGVVVVLRLIEWLFQSGHVQTPVVEYVRFQFFLAFGLAFAAVVAIGYLALEPLMRRRCPHRLTALARLLDGRWRDPLVGRDVLVAVALGIVSTMGFAALPFYATDKGPIVLDPPGFSTPIWRLVYAAEFSILVMWGLSSIFLIFSVVVRRDGIAAALVCALMVVAFNPARLGSELLIACLFFQLAVFLVVLLRFGVLALMVWGFVAFGIALIPVTLDSSAWYFGASLTKMLAVGGLAVYGAWASLGGRRLFADNDAGPRSYA